MNIEKILQLALEELARRVRNSEGEKLHRFRYAHQIAMIIKRGQIGEATVEGVIHKGKTYRWLEIDKLPLIRENFVIDEKFQRAQLVLAEMIGELRENPELEAGETLELISGEKITEAYAEEYLGSCMHVSRGHEGSKYIDVYGKSGAQMLILRKNGKLLARALIWDALNQQGEWVRYGDRIYGPGNVERRGRLMAKAIQACGAQLMYEKAERGAQPQGLKVLLEFQEGLPYIDSFSQPLMVYRNTMIALQGPGMLQQLRGNYTSIKEAAQFLQEGKLQKAMAEAAILTMREQIAASEEEREKANAEALKWIKAENEKANPQKAASQKKEAKKPADKSEQQNNAEDMGARAQAARRAQEVNQMGERPRQGTFYSVPNPYNVVTTRQIIDQIHELNRVRMIINPEEQ